MNQQAAALSEMFPDENQVVKAFGEQDTLKVSRASKLDCRVRQVELDWPPAQATGGRFLVLGRIQNQAVWIVPIVLLCKFLQWMLDIFNVKIQSEKGPSFYFIYTWDKSY